MNQTDFTKIKKASYEGNVKVISELLPKIDSTLPTKKDWLNELLVLAVRSKSVEAVDILLKAGANPNQDTSIGTLVGWPAGNGDLPMVKRLIEGGANFNREFKGETAMSAALAYSQLPVIEYLENLGAYSPPDTTLFYAAEQGDTKRAMQALAEGANVEKPGGPFGETPLMAAARKGQVDTIKLLLKRGADPQKRLKGSCALFDAVKHGSNLEVFDLLVAAGADIHAKFYEETLLMAAANAGCLPIVKRLVELGGNVHARDKNHNKTALDYAKSRNHQAVIDYLSSLGAKSERDAGRVLMKALARKYGGKPAETSVGFLLNAKLAGNTCQFFSKADITGALVANLHYKAAELKHAAVPGLIFSGEQTPLDPYSTPGKKVKVKSASDLLGITVRRASGGQAVPEKFIMDFCKRHREFFKQLNLSDQEQVGITSEITRFYWTGTDGKAVLARFNLFESFVKEISTPPLPERLLVKTEWLIRLAPKAGGAKSAGRHMLGGALTKPVACPHCGLATNLMAQLDLSDPVLPKTALGRRKFPVLWCMNCGEWDAAFFDISGTTPKPLAGISSKAANGCGEEDLPEHRAILAPVPSGKKAGHKSKLGGSPTWIQSETIPDCPKCKKPMAFILQLASDSRISYCDMGMLYSFSCPDCQMSASLIQSH